MVCRFVNEGCRLIYQWRLLTYYLPKFHSTQIVKPIAIGWSEVNNVTVAVTVVSAAFLPSLGTPFLFSIEHLLQTLHLLDLMVWYTCYWVWLQQFFEPSTPLVFSLCLGFFKMTEKIVMCACNTPPIRVFNNLCQSWLSTWDHNPKWYFII